MAYESNGRRFSTAKPARTATANAADQSSGRSPSLGRTLRSEPAAPSPNKARLMTMNAKW